MSYSLEAVIGGAEVMGRAAASCGGRLAPVGEGLVLMPLVDEVQARMAGTAAAGAPGPAKGDAVIGPWVREASREGRLAWIGAEFFGGAGTQWSLVADGGRVLLTAKGGDAINQALRLLGVRSREGQDEFDTVGLGRKRRTERWLEAAP